MPVNIDTTVIATHNSSLLIMRSFDGPVPDAKSIMRGIITGTNGATASGENTIQKLKVVRHP